MLSGNAGYWPDIGWILDGRMILEIGQMPDWKIDVRVRVGVGLEE